MIQGGGGQQSRLLKGHSGQKQRAGRREWGASVWGLAGAVGPGPSESQPPSSRG